MPHPLSPFRLSPLHRYLAGTGSWFLSMGMQAVLFAWLVTMVLRESAEKVGIAQMALLLPGTLLILFGGSLADRVGGRMIASLAHCLAALAPLMLLLCLLQDLLRFEVMIAYAVLLGTAQAFVTPARDGLLNQVAGGRVQRTVMLASIAQFGMQIVGALTASLADWGGAEPILMVQIVALLVGAYMLRSLPSKAEVFGANYAPPPSSARAASGELWRSMIDGARTVAATPSLRIIVIQNIAMALCFMGSFIVTLPLLAREVFNGSAADLSFINATNASGLVLTILILLRVGDIRRQGRALILSQLIGSVALGVSALMPSFSAFLLVIFIWGICGGIAMTMSRTIMQEQAPEAMRSRVMSFYGFSFMGAGPLGALLCGYLSSLYGPQQALMIAALGMLIVTILLALRSGLWRIASLEAAHAS
ncbi:MAG: MFS transporter [Pseudomonadota bacterium]